MALVQPLGDGDVEAIGSVALVLFWIEKNNAGARCGAVTISDAITSFAHIIAWPERDLRERFSKLPIPTEQK